MFEKVGFGPRLAAFAIDLALSGFFVTFILFTFFKDLVAQLKDMENLTSEAGSLQEIMNSFQGSMDQVMKAMVPLVLLTLVYWLIEGFMGASPGKMMLGLKIAKEDGNEAEIKDYLLRFALKNSQPILGILATLTSSFLLNMLSSAAGLVIFFGCLMVLGDTHQSIHDVLTKTAVFKKTDLESLENHSSN